MLSAARRDFLRLGVGGMLASTLQPLFGQESKPTRAKNCIVLWMAGGPSHVDTWDLKPGNGEFRPIDTSVSGLQISEHLPRLAQQAKSLAVVRSITSVEADHERATYYLHTGNRPDDSVSFPTLGAIASNEWPVPAEVPSFVVMGGEPYIKSGFLGREYAPFVVSPDGSPPSMKVAEALRTRIGPRRSLLDELNRGFANHSDAAAIAVDDKIQKRAISMMSSTAVKAFDIAQETAKVRSTYGKGSFGRGCLLARRLVEHGVRFVEVVLDGWDTHQNNFRQVKMLSNSLDAPMAALVQDLDERGMLDETLVLCLGEFGRTPAVKRGDGRDHYARAFSVVMAGGGTAAGRVVGRTDDAGGEVADRPVTIPDLYASIFHAFGFDPAKEYMAPGDRPVKLVDKGAVVPELFG